MKISIITVCLNSRETIEQTIKSVIKQNYEELEYIVIDGKSTDGTLEIINKYKNDLYRVISEKDDGIYDAMNKGIALATGDIIGIINSDDWYEPDIFGVINKCFQKPEVEVVYGKLNMINKNGEIHQIVPGDLEKMRYEMEIPHPTVFVKKEIYERYGTFQESYKIAADYELMLRFYTKGVKFQYLDKPLANYRIGGISLQQERQCAEETFLIAEKYTNYISLNEKEYFENEILHKWNLFWFQKLMDNFGDNLLNILERKLGINFKERIAIFGAGKWGVETGIVLREKGIYPLFYVDNNKTRWNGSESGLIIYPPKVLHSFDGILLIMVKNSSTRILKQMNEMGNQNMHCITWEEIAADFMLSERNLD